jgi:hypothetical protein
MDMLSANIPSGGRLLIAGLAEKQSLWNNKAAIPVLLAVKKKPPHPAGDCLEIIWCPKVEF